MPYLDHWGTYEQRARANLDNQNGGDMRITKTDVPNAVHRVDMGRDEVELLEVQRAISIGEMLKKHPNLAMIWDKGDLGVMVRALYCYVDGPNRAKRNAFVCGRAAKG